MSIRPSDHRIMFALAQCVVCLTICTTGFGCTQPIESDPRFGAFKICISQLTRWKYLPEDEARDAAGRPTCSWRFTCDYAVITSSNPAIQPWHDGSIPWDAESLKEFRRQRPEKYCFFDDTTTNVMAVVGEGTAFQEDEEVLTSELPSDLILLIEVGNSGVHWMEPKELNVKELPGALLRKKDALRVGTSDDGFFVGFVDGTVWMLSYEIPTDILLQFCSRDSADRYDRNRLLGKYRIHKR